MRILLTGAKGQVGRCFKDRLPEDWELIATDSKTLDITDAQSVLTMMQNFEPDAIVNAAAYTAVDKAEQDIERAFAVNATGTHNLATAAQSVGARFVHISTDYVFDGNQSRPYTETDYPNPQNVYGRSKLVGELFALAGCRDTIVLRTSWVFSEYGHNFVKTMLRLGQEKDTLSIVGDQIGCPTYAGDIAAAIIQILEKPDALTGLYHSCGSVVMSWYDFSDHIFKAATSIDQNHKHPKLVKIATQDFPTAACRPMHSILDQTKIIGRGFSVTALDQALKQVISVILKSKV